MKKFISSVLISAMMLSLSLCYSERMMSSPINLNEVQDSDIIVSVETKDGRTILNERPKAVYKSNKGLYVVDTTGNKIHSYKEVQSVRKKTISYFKQASLVDGVRLWDI